MLVLIAIYFAGKAFYTLAEEHNKNKWLFAITGVLSYYAGSFLGGIIGYLVYDMLTNYYEPNELIATAIGVLIGVLVCWAYYQLLKRNWENKVFEEDDSILDEDFTTSSYSDDDILEADNWK